MEQARRNAIAEKRGAGRSPADIAKVVKYPMTTVFDVCKKYDKCGDVFRGPHKLMRERKLTSRFLSGLKRSVKVNPTTRMTILAKKRGVSRRSIGRGLAKLKLTSYVQGKRHLLTDRMRGISLQRCKKLITWMKGNGGVISSFQMRRTSR